MIIEQGSVVPATTYPWIWPSNGQILRGPYQIFWILPLMEVFRHVYMTNYSYIHFWWLKDWGSMIFHWCFGYDHWWLIFPIVFLISWVNWWLSCLLWMTFDGMFIFELIWVITYPSKVFQVIYHCLPFSPFQWPFSPFEGLCFLTFLMSLF